MSRAVMQRPANRLVDPSEVDVHKHMTDALIDEQIEKLQQEIEGLRARPTSSRASAAALESAVSSLHSGRRNERAYSPPVLALPHRYGRLTPVNPSPGFTASAPHSVPSSSHTSRARPATPRLGCDSDDDAPRAPPVPSQTAPTTPPSSRPPTASSRTKSTTATMTQPPPTRGTSRPLPSVPVPESASHEGPSGTDPVRVRQQNQQAPASSRPPTASQKPQPATVARDRPLHHAALSGPVRQVAGAVRYLEFGPRDVLDSGAGRLGIFDEFVKRAGVAL